MHDFGSFFMLGKLDWQLIVDCWMLHWARDEGQRPDCET